jgi:hypothetical protein
VFLRFSSLNGVSLWLVILTQALILSSLIYLFLKLLLKGSIHRNGFFIALMAFLSLLTSASWTTSQLISDVFTPIMILSFVLLAFGKWSRWFQVVLYVLFLIATAMHMSHITFNVAFFITIIVFRKWNAFGLKEHVSLKPVLICLTLSILSISTMGSALSKSKHAFLMGALVEHGIAQEYLEEHCGEEEYVFCQYKDSLPERAWEFIWLESSPFYAMGGFEGTKDEFNEIISGTLTSPKYLWMHFKESIKASGDQLIKYRIGDGNGPYLNETPLYKRIAFYFPQEIEAFRTSRQNRSEFGFLSWYNTLLGIVLLMSSLMYLFVFLKSEKRMKGILFILFLSIIYNAWICGTFANAIDRLGAKVMWMIPLVAFIGIANHFYKSKKQLGN